MTPQEDSKLEAFELALMLKGILLSWRRNSHITTEQMAKKVGLTDSSALRAFLSEKKIAQHYRSDNLLVNSLRDFLENNIESIKNYIDRKRYNQFLIMIGNFSRDVVVYSPRKEMVGESNPDSISSFNEVISDYFGANSEMDHYVYPLIKGRYYCYRSSSYGGSIIRASINIDKLNDGAVYFEHYHPDSHHKSIYGNQKPRKTIGNVFQSKDNFFLLANSGANHGATFYSMKIPYSMDVTVIVGFVVCPSSSRKIVSARTVFVKDDSASPDTVERIRLNLNELEETSKKIGFDVNVLKVSSEEFIADSLRSLDEALYYQK